MTVLHTTNFNGTNNFYVIIPSRLASTRLPNKPLADLGGKPMVVRVAEQAKLSGAALVVVACDDRRIRDACLAHGIDARLTSPDHQSGTDRIAEVAASLELPPDAVIVNVQGDEPLIEPALIMATAAQIGHGIAMATAAHPIVSAEEAFNPNVVKVVLDRNSRALYFSRATIPWHRDGFAQSTAVLPSEYRVYRHIGLYAYTNAFLQKYSTLEVAPLETSEVLEQLRVLWNGYQIAVHVTPDHPEAGVDTAQDLLRVQQHYLAQGPG